MKKILLTSILSIIGFIGFSSAVELSCDSNNGCVPDTLNLNSCIEDLKITCVGGTEDNLQFTFFSDFDTDGYLGSQYLIDGSLVNLGEPICSIAIGYYGDGPETFNCNFIDNSSVSGGGEGGTNIIQGGINAFSGIIDRLGSIFGEFGPYIIYIAIACLGISLLFRALKYILGFTDNSAKNSIGGRFTMQERRTQRRRLKRMKKNAGNFNYRYNEYIKKGINKKEAKEQANYMVKNRNRIGKKYGYRK